MKRLLLGFVTIAAVSMLVAGCYPMPLPDPGPSVATGEPGVASTPADPAASATPPGVPERTAFPPDQLLGVTWQWTDTSSDGDPNPAPADPSRYTLQFLPDGILSVQSDCNRGRGGYTFAGASLHIGQIATTKMACAPGSLDALFLEQLASVAFWGLSGDSLVLDLATGTGEMWFAAAPALPAPSVPAATPEPVSAAPSAPTGDWTLVTFLDPAGTPVEIVAGAEATLTFTPEGTANGSAGCNRFFGSLKLDAENLALSSLGSTQMACSEELMAQEKAVFAALLTARTWKIADNGLTISYGDARGALVFTRK